MTLPFLNKIKVASTSRNAKGELAVVQVGFFLYRMLRTKMLGVCVIVFNLNLNPVYM
jgi:hypothetical protein